MTDMCSHSMKLFVIGCVLITYYLHVLLAQRGCSFSPHSRDERRSPIILYNDTSMVIPTKGRVRLKSDEVVALLCPDPNNYLVQSRSNTTFARCIQGKILRVAEQDFNFDDLHCHRVTKGVVSATSKRCGDDRGFIHRIGYQLSARFFITLIEICYDNNTASTLYAEHSLYGQGIKSSSKLNYRPAFSTATAAAAAASVSAAYTQVHQKTVLNQLLRSPALAETYVNRTSFLVRGHLAPHADFLFASTQYTTYFYLNVCPQWQAINGANWVRVEGMVRERAHRLRETLTVITGTHEVLSIPNADGKQVEIFLVSGKKLPVPKFVWKIVYSKNSKEAVVLISLNNPFISELKRNDVFCSNICSRTGWNSTFWGDYKRGFVYCCEYGEFFAVVNTAPKLEVTGILQGPK